MNAPARGGATRRNMVLLAVAALLIAIAGATCGVFVFVKDQPLPRATPEPSLLGEVVPVGQATHVTSAAALQITAGQPPAGGPHFPQPLTAGVSTVPVEDGNAIHSLEHGMIWISYRADLITAADLALLTTIARGHPNDVLLTPRPQNSAAASIVSWGRRLTLPVPVPRQAVEDFITTNLNQSPEPGVR